MTFLALLKLGGNPDPEVTDAFTTVLFNTTRRMDPWTRKAVLSGSKNRAGLILAEMLRRYRSDRITTGVFDENSFTDTIREFAAATASRGDVSRLEAVLAEFNHPDAPAGPWKFAFAEGLSTGLRRSPLKQKSLGAFIASPPEKLQWTNRWIKGACRFRRRTRF